MLDVSPTYASEIVMHPTYRGVASSLLTQKNWFWEGLNKQWAVSRPQLSNTIVFSIAPGAAAQPLHRDDSIHQMVPKAVDVYPEDELRDASLGFFVAAKKATRENGATRVIPGSHLWDHEQPPDEELCTYAEMEKGDAFLMLASCFHAGSANKTTDEERLIFSTFATRGTLRQEENQYLSVSQEKMKLLPVETQKFAGYSLSEPFLGWVSPCLLLDVFFLFRFVFLFMCTSEKANLASLCRSVALIQESSWTRPSKETRTCTLAQRSRPSKHNPGPSTC